MLQYFSLTTPRDWLEFVSAVVVGGPLALMFFDGC